MLSLQDEKIAALARYLNIKEDDIGTDSYDEKLLTANDFDYLVLDDEDADEEVKKQILDMVWSFNADFIKSHSSVNVSTKLVRMVQQEFSKDSNDMLLLLIDDKDEFVRNAIACEENGRGYFLSPGDGIEVSFDDFYIYLQ